MPKKKRKIRISKRYILIFALICLLLPVVLFPDRYVQSVAGGLNLYALSVLPALFPFFFFSKILAELNFGYDLGLTLRKPLKKCFNAPPVSGYILVMSMLCGYPIGAKLISDFYAQGMLSQSDAKSVAAFTSTSGPLFIVGTVGAGMLGDKTVGFVILLSHYLAALINGFLFRAKHKEDGSAPMLLPAAPKIRYDEMLSESMTSSILSVAIVGGYIAVFNLVLDLAFDLNIISALARLPALLGLNLRLSEGLAASFIEITKGCLILSQSGFGTTMVAPLCALGITFGGLSVTLQSMTYLAKCKISPAYYLFFKASQGIIAFLICLGLCFLIFN